VHRKFTFISLLLLVYKINSNKLQNVTEKKVTCAIGKAGK
jgi:hypothetical protein